MVPSRLFGDVQQLFGHDRAALVPAATLATMGKSVLGLDLTGDDAGHMGAVAREVDGSSVRRLLLLPGVGR